MTALTSSPAWKDLARHAETMRGVHLRELFEDDPKRFERFSLTEDGFLLDYSKNRITAETLDLLLALGREADVEGWRDRMFALQALLVPCCH